MSVDYFQRQHIATWNNARGVWEKDQMSLLCAHSVLFSATWPASGMTLNGQAYELQTLAHHITVSESSSSPIPEDSMLRTPSAIEGQGGAITEKQSRERGRMLQVRDQMAQLAAENGLKVSDGIAGSLLPTVKARDSNPEGYEAGLRRGLPQLGTMVKAIVDGDDRLDLLPTPNTMEHREIKTPEQIAEMKAKSPGGYRNLRESVINELLPTPQAMEGAKGNNLSVADRAATGQVMLSNYAVELATNGPAVQEQQTLLETTQNLPEKTLGISWGKFEPAIRRWEQVLGRPAPAPTLPDGKDGNHRLAAVFTEWMMGLPEGHVTDPALGLSRVEQLKLCGNGVVPQQAQMALEILLEGVDW